MSSASGVWGDILPNLDFVPSVDFTEMNNPTSLLKNGNKIKLSWRLEVTKSNP